MTTIEGLTQRFGFVQGAFLKKSIKDPIYQGVVLTALLLIIGGIIFSQKSKELIKLEKEEAITREDSIQKEKNVAILEEEVKKINSKLQKRYLAGGNLTANDRKMSSILEKMALLAAGRTVEMVSFRPESIVEGEKDNLLTVKVKVKTHFNELKEYISRIKRFPSPVKIDWVAIETFENETPMVYGDLLVITRIMKEKNEK
ncbi:MAG: type 4a pilus biogenesis protein PilO [Nitrospiria bacterium]